MQQAIDRDVTDNAGNELGILTYLGPGNSVINEEVNAPEQDVDPLQQIIS